MLHVYYALNRLLFVVRISKKRSLSELYCRWKKRIGISSAKQNQYTLHPVSVKTNSTV